MKAARLHSVGEPLIIEDVDVPKPKGRQVLVRVKSAGVCHSDVHYKSGTWGKYTIQSLGFQSPPLPLTMGHEIAGVIEEVGEDVNNLDVKTPVAINPWEGEGLCHYCSIGEEQMCDNPLRLGINVNGGYAEFVLVPDYRYLKVIKNLSFDEAAPMTCSGVTTYRALKETGISPSKTVVVIGSGGGLGTLAIKLGKAMGITSLIGVDVNDEGIRLTKNAGADFAINAISESVEKEIMSITNGNGADGIIDLNSSEKTLAIYPKLLSKLGTYVMVGQFGSQLNINAISLVRKAQIFRGTFTGNNKDFVEVMDLAEKGHITPVTKYVGGLDKVNESLDRLASLKVSGRQIIRP